MLHARNKIELRPSSNFSASPLLEIVSRDALRSKPPNAKQRFKVQRPIYQAFLYWLFEQHRGMAGAPVLLESLFWP